MDNKTWPWRKRSTEKTIVATNKFDNSVKGISEEKQKLPSGNEGGLVRPVRNLNEKLASVLLDCHATDDIVTKQGSQEAHAGQKKEEAEPEVLSLKRDLDQAVRQAVAANERLAHSDAALKQCMLQLSSFREQQEQRIHDAVMKASSEFEKAQKKLEEKLMETTQRLANVAIENTNLSNTLLVKEKLVEELHKRASQTVAEFNALMARLDSTEKENAFLKYEFHMLEKELQVRNEELEYIRRSADTSRRQHLESVKKITKLEAECQRLRILMRKRLPGPVALAKMKNEVEMMGRDPRELRKLNPTRDLMLRDTSMEKSSAIPVQNINYLVEQLRGMEEENKTLKEIMTKKNAELQSSRNMFSRTAMRLSQAEAQLIGLSGGQKSMELTKCGPVSNELQSPIAGSDIGSDDRVSSSGSWANALMLELEHFTEGKLKHPSERKAIKVSDMSLMDDFVEMEKLAIISVQAPSLLENHPLSAGKEIVPVVQGHLGSGDKKQEVHSKDVTTDKSFDWLQDVLNAIFKQQRISKQSLPELLEDIKVALGYVSHPNSHEVDVAALSGHSTESDIQGYITWKSPNTSTVDLLNEASSTDTTSQKSSQSNLSKSVCKIIELIEGINLTPLISNETTDDGSKRGQNSSPSSAPADYFVRVFKWRCSELSAVLKQFVHTCNSLLDGKADLQDFSEALWFTLDWIVSSFVTPEDDSNTRKKIKKKFGWNESQSENEVGVSVDCPLVELDTIGLSKKQPSCFCPVASSHYQNISFRIQRNLQEENKRLKDELNNMESAKKEMEARLQSAADEALMMQVRESEQSIESLQAEMETLKESKGLIEEQIEHQKSINEDLDTQLTVSKAKLNEVLQKFSSLEVELEDRSNCCEELEATCLELQLQLESIAKKETLNSGMNEEGKQPQNGWEITAASVKLAECQETILNLGKQLKALASPREAALFDKVFSATSATTTASNIKNLNRRFSLRDQMLAEDRSKAIVLRSSNEDEQKSSLNNSDNGNVLTSPNILVCTPVAYSSSKHKTGNAAVGALAIVPSKKQGFGLLRRLLMRRKRTGGKKSQSLVKA